LNSSKLLPAKFLAKSDWAALISTIVQDELWPRRRRLGYVWWLWNLGGGVEPIGSLGSETHKYEQLDLALSIVLASKYVAVGEELGRLANGGFAEEQLQYVSQRP
jgi:hypothetical protein